MALVAGIWYLLHSYFNLKSTVQTQKDTIEKQQQINTQQNKVTTQNNIALQKTTKIAIETHKTQTTIYSSENIADLAKVNSEIVDKINCNLSNINNDTLC
jgi:hypothetical protein